MRLKRTTLLLITFILLIGGSVKAEQTMRLDYFHSGTASEENFSIDQLIIEPLAWPGSKEQAEDKLKRGKYLFEVLLEGKKPDEIGKHFFSRSFSSIYGEWETTREATQIRRSFHESIRFPRPPGNFRIIIKKRMSDNLFTPVWEIELDPDDYMNHREQALYQQDVIAIETHGDPKNKVDLLILGDGYSKNEQSLFSKQARSMSNYFLSSFPFSQRREDFNIWALAPEAKTSGVSRPSTGRYIDSPLGATYDSFRSERYVLTFDNKSWRRVASSAAYDAVIIITNSNTYGGGGIYGLYSTAAAGSQWANYLFVHEFGHHFAGLADEYFTSSVAYQTPTNITEPYEPNVTALLEPENIKWKHLLTSEVPLPTPWPKEAFETHSLKYQKIRKELRRKRRPESEMDQLFIDNQIQVESMFEKHQHSSSVGAFEGANYQSRGYYRSSMNCIMFTRSKDFCQVCSEAIEQMIDMLTR